ncbi:tail fiber repeat 2-containing protein [Yersinia kristensenii]|uniref:Tail fiber repeat 2-containing protein n=2 Tax=Yersinia kristensenii TaxID=28152 RepID=A0A0T9KX86_YERKR|nr:tail fiber repeat 2-containing protein [Yersinia kristensenii]
MMSQSIITTAFEQWKASEAAGGNTVVVDEFVLALVPGLNPNTPINRSEGLPPAGQIVHRQAVNKTGVVNQNAVVYSVTIGTEIGDFDFNWIGLVNKASGTVAMIVHAPTQRKIANANGQQGNALTRSFLMEYDGAASETGITVPAETWQIDFTARLTGIDERQRLINLDHYGPGAFFGNGFLVAKTGQQYYVTAGNAYVGGLRAVLAANKNITVSAKPVKVWADVSLQGNVVSQWESVVSVSVATTLADYQDNAGFMHRVFAVASIDAAGNITDLRPQGSLTDDALAKHEKSRNHPDGTLTEKGFVKLSSATDSNSETLAATPKAVKAVMDSASNSLELHEKSRNHPDGTLLYKGFVQLTSATDSTSETLAATPKAVKVAMDSAAARLAKDRNGADIPNVPLFRQNLALKGAALVDIGKVAGTVAAGDDSRIVNALPATGGTMTGPLEITGVHALPVGPNGYKSNILTGANGAITNSGGTGIGVNADKGIYFWNDNTGYAMSLTPTRLSMNRPIEIYGIIGTGISMTASSNDAALIIEGRDDTGPRWRIGNTIKGNRVVEIYNVALGTALQVGNTINGSVQFVGPSFSSDGDLYAGKGATTYGKNGDIKGAIWGNGLLSTYINAMRSTSSLAANGWCRDPVSKMIIQWCTGPAIIHETLNVVTKFPIPFPAACLMAHVSTKNPAQDINSDVWYQVASWDNTGATCILQRPGGGTAGAAVYPLFIAIGF